MPHRVLFTALQRDRWYRNHAWYEYDCGNAKACDRCFMMAADHGGIHRQRCPTRCVTE
jgi:hypothetical protein